MFLTDKQIAAYGLPTDPAEAGQVLADAAAVYAQVEANPWISQDDLSKWAEGEWDDAAPDRLIAALELLRSAGRLVDVQADSPPAIGLVGPLRVS